MTEKTPFEKAKEVVEKIPEKYYFPIGITTFIWLFWIFKGHKNLEAWKILFMNVILVIMVMRKPKKKKVEKDGTTPKTS